MLLNSQELVGKITTGVAPPKENLEMNKFYKYNANAVFQTVTIENVVEKMYFHPLYVLLVSRRVGVS